MWWDGFLNITVPFAFEVGYRNKADKQPQYEKLRVTIGCRILSLFILCSVNLHIYTFWKIQGLMVL